MIPTDFLVRNRDGFPVLGVEVKSGGFDRDSATSYRRNLRVLGRMPEYFLLVLPHRFYLWHEAPDEQKFEPDWEADAGPALASWFEGTPMRPETIRGESFEILVSGWLNEVTRMKESDVRATPHLAWLVESGLYQAIASGSLVYEGRHEGFCRDQLCFGTRLSPGTARLM